MQPETKFKIQVTERLKQLDDCWWFKSQEVSKRGIPDIIGCRHGIFIALELKTDSGRVSRLQQWTLDSIRKAGGYAKVVAPRNLTEVMREIEEL